MSHANGYRSNEPKRHEDHHANEPKHVEDHHAKYLERYNDPCEDLADPAAIGATMITQGNGNRPSP